MKTLQYQLLFLLICFVNIGCTPRSTNTGDVPLSESLNLEVQSVCTDMDNINKEQENIMSSYEKRVKSLMVNQDYQGALNLMPQLESELQEKWADIGISAVIRGIYCYLYVALGRDEEALQNLMEFKLPNDNDPELAYLVVALYFDKVAVMSRLNMADGIISETKAIHNNHDLMSSLHEKAPYLYLDTLDALFFAQLAKDDLESAQYTVKQKREYLKKFSYKPSYKTVEGQQFFFKYNEALLFHEYYLNNLTTTHTFCFVKNKPDPPVYAPDAPDKIKYGLLTKCEFASKTDGSLFTIEDFRKVTAASLIDPFPIIDTLPKQQNNETQTGPK